MIFLQRAIMASLMFCLFNLSAYATEFLSVMEEVPLMEGMVEQADSVSVFDTPVGYITSIRASGSARDLGNQEVIKTFYRQSLHAMGWEYDEGHDIFRKYNSQLSITINAENLKDRFDLHFRLIHTDTILVQ